MRINFYEAKLTEDDRTMLVKEKTINYKDGRMDNPKEIAVMMRELLHMEQMAEEWCYMLALNSSCKILGIFLQKCNGQAEAGLRFRKRPEDQGNAPETQQVPWPHH